MMNHCAGTAVSWGTSLLPSMWTTSSQCGHTRIWHSIGPTYSPYAPHATTASSKGKRRQGGALALI